MFEETLVSSSHFNLFTRVAYVSAYPLKIFLFISLKHWLLFNFYSQNLLDLLALEILPALLSFVEFFVCVSFVAWSHSVAQASLEFSRDASSVSQVLVLQV